MTAKLPPFVLAGLVTIVATQLHGCGWFTSAEQRVQHAEQLAAEGDHRAAVIELQNALRSRPELIGARLLLANSSLHLGDVRGAVQELEAATSHGANAEQVGPALAETKLALGEYRNLLTAIEKKEIALNEPLRSVIAGFAHLGLDEVPAATDSFARALAQDANFHRARLGLAECLASSGHPQEALAELDKVLAADPKNAVSWSMKGNLLSREGDANSATAALKKARENADDSLTAPQYVGVLAALTDAQLASGDLSAAEETHQALVARSPDWPVTRLLNARIAMRKQDYGLAVAELQQALQSAPQLAAGRLLLATALIAQGNLNQAEAQLSEFVQQVPDSTHARTLLAEVNLRLRRPEVAMELLAKAGPMRDPRQDALLGWAKLQKGDQTAAVALLERSAAAAPDNANIRMDLASAYLANGQSAKAVAALRSMPSSFHDTRRDVLLVAAVSAASGKDAASAEMQRIVAANPGNLATLNIAAAYYARVNEYARAGDLLRRALASNQADARTLLNLARLESQHGDQAAAKAHLKKLISIEPNNTAAKLQLAEVTARAGDSAGAIEILQQLRSSDAKAIKPRLALARIYLEKQKATEAGQVIRELSSIAPGDAPLSHAIGTLYYETGDFDQALASFRSAVQHDSGNPQYLMSLGQVQMAEADISRARESFERAIELQPDSIVANHSLAMLDLRDGKADAARARIAKLKSEHPNDPRVATLEGDLETAARSYEAAADAYVRAARLSPSGIAAIRIYRARQLGKLPEALAPLEQWVKDHPEDTTVQFELAEALLSTGQTSQAVELYERLARASAGAENVKALNNLAWLYHTKGDARAITTAKAAYDKAPDSAPIADTYAWILVQRGDVSSGLPILEKAARTSRPQPDIRFHYAYALARAGRRDDARRELLSLLDSGGGYTSEADAKRLLRELGG